MNGENMQKAKDLLASAELIHPAETVVAAVARVAGEISEQLCESNPCLLYTSDAADE